MKHPRKKAIYWERDKPATASKNALNVRYALEAFNETVALVSRYLPSEFRQQYAYVENHAQTFEGFTHKIVAPKTEAGIRKIVRHAREAGIRVRVIGKLHSYNDIFHTDTCSISLEHFKKCVLHADRSEVTCGAGVSVMELCEFLDARGYALKYSGNYGEQTIIGAISTGTHGYYRNGGVLSELVAEVRIIDADGVAHDVRDEKELQVLRLSFGSLGIITEVTFSIVPKGALYQYEVQTFSTHDFLKEYKKLCETNEYIRFYPNYVNYDTTFVLTINPAGGGAIAHSGTGYIGDGKKPHSFVLSFLEALILNRVSRGIAKYVLRQYSFSCITELSSFLFVKAGIVKGSLTVQRYIYSVVSQDTTYNMELAVPLKHYRAFYRVITRVFKKYPEVSHGKIPYFTCRYVGASKKVLLAPNYEADMIFVDIHCSKKSLVAEQSMKEIESAAVGRFKARVHWGKKFYSTHKQLRELYPARSWKALQTMKKKYDPVGLYSNEYSRRVLGI